MKRISIVFTVCLIAFAACFLLFPAAALGDSETASRPKPTVRPQAIPYDHTLPATKLTDENVLEFFSIELGKEYSRGKKLAIPFTISPVEAYDQYNGSSRNIAVRLEISVFLNEDEEEPYRTKSYIVMLRRAKGFKASGVIEVLLKLDQDNIWYTWQVIGCNGRVGIEEGSD